MASSEEKRRFIQIPSLESLTTQVQSIKELRSLKSNRSLPLKFILSSAQNTNKHLFMKDTGLSIAEEVPTSVSTESFTSRVREVLKLTIPQNQTKKEMSISTSATLPKKKSPEKTPSIARERRLKDIESFRKIRTKGSIILPDVSSPIPKLSSTTSTLKKSSSMTQTSLISLVKKREIAETFETRNSAQRTVENASTAFSIDSPLKENRDADTAPYSFKNIDPILSRDNFSPDLSKSPTSIIYKDKWRDYNDKASEALINLKPANSGESPKAKTKRDSSVERIQSMRPTFSQFVQEKLDPQTVERLDTLGAFAFDSVEKHENQEIPTFLNATRSGREPEGTMRVVDLWSTKHRHKVLKYANLDLEKRKIQRFTIINKKDLISEKSVKRDDEKVKVKLAIKELNQANERQREEGLMSPMKRHLALQGKTFYKAKKSMEFQETGSSTKLLADEIGCLINDMDRLQEENQNDYVKLLEVCTANEKIAITQKLKESYRIQKVNNHLDVESWKQKINKNL